MDGDTPGPWRRRVLGRPWGRAPWAKLTLVPRGDGPSHRCKVGAAGTLPDHNPPDPGQPWQPMVLGFFSYKSALGQTLNTRMGASALNAGPPRCGLPGVPLPDPGAPSLPQVALAVRVWEPRQEGHADQVWRRASFRCLVRQMGGSVPHSSLLRPQTNELPLGGLQEIRLALSCGAAAPPTHLSVSIYLRGSIAASS